MTSFRITSEPLARREDRLSLLDRMEHRSVEKAGQIEGQAVNLFIRDETDRIRGGLVGDVWGGWFHIAHLWVDEELRSQDYGARLLELAEAEAQSHGAQGAYLETFSTETRQFYEQYGYVVFASVDDFPPGHFYYILRKQFPAP